MIRVKNLYKTMSIFALLLLIVSLALGQSSNKEKPDTLSPTSLGEEKYQEMKAKGLLPQPEQVPPPTQLKPENIITPEAIERSKGLLIPLDESFTHLVRTSEEMHGIESEYQRPGYEVKLRSRKFTPSADVKSLLSKMATKKIQAKDLLSRKIHGVVQFHEIPTDAQKSFLKEAGIQLHDYLPNYAYTASIDPGVTPEQLTSLGVRALFEFERKDKLSEQIIRGEIGDWARPIAGRVDVIVRYYPDISNSAADSVLLTRRAEILSSSDYFHRSTIRIDESKLSEIADFEWVSWIEPIPPPPTEYNDGSRASIRVNELQAVPYNLTGTGIRIGEWDGGSIFAHQGFGTRLTIIDNVAISDHSTHVAGTMAGDGSGSANNNLRGMATAADIYSWDYNGDIPTEMANGITNQSIVLSQNSWGADMCDRDPVTGICRITNDLFGIYGAMSGDLDRLVRDNNLQIVFAAANDRNNAWYTRFRTTGYTSIPYGGGQNSKNTIVVGAVTKADAMTTFSAWGPSVDGRLKPDVVAVGQSVSSTLPTNGYSGYTWNGTSMACPAVSGTVALLMQRYRQLNNSNDPPPELIKAILLNTATDLGNPGPDYSYGYGKVDALAAVNVIDRSGYIVNSISQGNTRNHTVPIRGERRIKVILAYSDRQAAANANPALVNNLDLTLIAPNGTQYLPLTLDPANPGNNAAPGVNNRDNGEQVVVENPMSGDWTIRVTAPTVPFGPQDYAVTWDWDHRYSVASFTNGAPPEYRNDDGSTVLIPLSFPFTFYSSQYNQVYINNNGNLSFDGPYWQYTPTGFPISDYAMIAAFWGDVDTRNGTSGLVYYRSEPHRFTVIWDRVGYYGYHADKLNTFEIIVTDGTDPLIGVGNNVCFSYGDMQWTTGDASGGSGGFGGAPATVGINRGDGINYALKGRFDHEGLDYDGPGGNPDGISYLDNKIYYFNVAQGLGTVSGTLFNDANGNCVRDPGEAGLPGWTIMLNPGGLATLTDVNGNYFFSFLTPNTYTISEILKPNWQQTCPLQPGTHTVVLNQGQTVTDRNFGNRALANVQDLSVSVGGGPARPGFQKFYGITYQNLGTITTSGTVTLSLPSQVSHLESSPGGIYDAVTHSVTWNVGSLAAGFIGWLWSKVQIPVNIPLGTTLTSTARINPTSGDVNPANNVSTERQTVRGSYDPNEKLATPQGDILRTDTLIYQINFQNVGTDTAFNIIVRDSLDDDLDIATMENGASSHPNVFLLVGRELSWTFTNIRLPDSNINEPGSHGFVTFKVRPRSDAADGAEILNRGIVYFDYNPPVITNTVFNHIAVPTILARVTCIPSTWYASWLPQPIGTVRFYIGGLTQEHSANDIVPSSIRLNDVLSTYLGKYRVISSWPGFAGPVMEVAFNRYEALRTLGTLTPGQQYPVKITGKLNNGIDFTGETMITVQTSSTKQIAEEAIPENFSLIQNYPNPFNPETDIEYALPVDCQVNLTIYNLLGQKVITLVDEYQNAGHKTVHWNGKDEQGNLVSSGIYFYRIQADDFTKARKMVIIK